MTDAEGAPQRMYTQIELDLNSESPRWDLNDLLVQVTEKNGRMFRLRGKWLSLPLWPADLNI